MSTEPERDVAYRERTDRFWILRLHTEVRDDDVCVKLTPLHRSFRPGPFSEVVEVPQTTSSPATYAGWHRGESIAARRYRVSLTR